MTPAAVLSILVKQQGVQQTSADLETLDKNARRAGASADKSGKMIGLAFKAMAVGAVGVGAGLVGTVKASADFEKQMSSLKAVTDSNAATMAQFKKQAIDAGIKTAFSAKQAAEAQTELAKGGLSVANIMGGGLSSALALAAAGNLDLGEAAATTANAMNLFGLKGAKSKMVADQLAMAANATTADVHDFSEALKQGGAVAKSAGLSFTETNVALEALAASGVKGSDAGTSLKTALLQMIAPSSTKAAAAMEEFGLKFTDANGNMKDMASISAMLRDKLGGMTAAQRTSTLATIVGTDGVRTLTSLYDAGPAKLDAFRKGLEKQGTAAKVAATMQDNLAGKFEQFKGTIETIAIVVGDKLRPTVQQVVIALTDFANGLLTGQGAGGQFRDAVVTAFTAVKTVVMDVVANVREFVQQFQDGQGKAVALGAALAGLAVGAVAIQAISSATKAWTAAQVALDVAMSANPIGLVIAGLVAFGAAIYVAYQKSATFRDAVNGTWNTIKSVVGSVVAWLSGAVTTVINEVSQWKVLFAVVSAAWKTYFAIMKADLLVVVAAVKIAFAVISTTVRVAMSVLGPIVSAAWDGIKKIFSGALNVLAGLVKIFGGVLKGDFGQMWDGVKQIFRGAWSVLQGYMQTGIGSIVTAMGKVPGKILRAVGDLDKLLLGAGEDVVGGLLSGIRSAVKEIAGAADWLKDQVVTAVKKAFGISSPSKVMMELGGHMASGLIKGVLAGNIMGFIKDHLGGVSSLAGSAVGGIKGALAGLLGGGGKRGGGETSSSGLVSQVMRALAFARAHGWRGSVTSGFRSVAEQQYLWDHASELGLARGKTVAPPGRSSHQSGQAVDVSDIAGFARAMAMAPASARLYSNVPGDPVHFSVSGHALGTSGAGRGLAWVGERGPELVNFKGGEQVFSHADSMRMAPGGIPGFSSGTISPTTLAQIRRIQRQRELANPLGGLDINNTIKGATGLAQDNVAALQENTDALNAQNALLQEQVGLWKQQALEAQNTVAVSQSQYGVLAKAIADIANAQIGQRVGIGLSGLRAPAGAVSRA